MKRCSMCATERPESEFNTYTRKGVTRRRAYCKPCGRESSRRANVRRNWNLELEEYDRLRAECAVCGRSDITIHLDHCHTENRVRGALCMNCNRAVGHLQDSPELARRVAEYLENPPLDLPVPEGSDRLVT